MLKIRNIETKDVMSVHRVDALEMMQMFPETYELVPDDVSLALDAKKKLKEIEDDKKRKEQSERAKKKIEEIKEKNKEVEETAPVKA